MKRVCKLIGASIFAAVVGFQSLTVWANEMTQMDVDVFLHEDGSATVTENRQMTMDDGTELFISFGNLQDGQDIVDFEVEGFQEVQDWDIDASQEDKAGRYGIYDNDGTLELVWGIGDYGDNAYQLTYTISNVVRDLEDGQAMYFDFNTSPDIEPENLTVRVHSDFDFTQDLVDFWGFGTEGNIQLEDGDILWQSTGEVENAVILMQFPQGTYNTNVTDDLTLAEQEEMAKDGSLYDDTGIGDFIAMGILGLVGLGGLGIGAASYSEHKKIKQAGHLASATKLMRRNDDKDSATAPKVKDPADLFYLNHHIFSSGFEDVFQAYLIKWMHEGLITIDFEVVEKFFSDKVKALLKVNQDITHEDKNLFHNLQKQVANETYEGTYEALMWSVILNAADDQGLINNEQIKDWGDDYADEIEGLADYLDPYSRNRLEAMGYFDQSDLELTMRTFHVMNPTSQGQDLIDQVIQYKNYLNKEKVKDHLSRLETDAQAYNYILWQTLFGKAGKIDMDLEYLSLKSTGKTSIDPDDHPIYYYHYPSYAMRSSYSQGLGAGGFSSASSGAGGATGIGGGGGAGGASGGGAR